MSLPAMPPPSDTARLPTVLVLASGRGERFLAAGGGCHKLQADLLGRSVLQRTLDAVMASGLPWHLEDRGWPGMGDAIAAAVQATPGAQGWLILPADLPLLQARTLRRLACAEPEVEVLVPTVHGQPGHPVRFARALGPQLAALTGPRGAAALLPGRAVRHIAVDDEGCVLDIDLPADLERARKRWSMRQEPGL